MRYITAVCCALAMTALVTPAAHADDYNKRTILTFSGPVQVPGVTLPAGTYTFKLADPENSRRVIQIWNKDATHLYTTLLTISNERMEPTDKPVVMFKETAPGQPQAVQAWFYPGDRYGEEFVYPKDQAAKIAKASHTPVLATAENKSDEASLRGAKVGRVDENGQFTAENNANANQNNTNAKANANAKPESVTAQNRQSQPIGTSGAAQAQANNPPSRSASSAAPANSAQNNAARSNSAQSNTRSARTELPRTASPLPLAMLLSVLLFALAATVHRVRLAGMRR